VQGSTHNRLLPIVTVLNLALLLWYFSQLAYGLSSLWESLYLFRTAATWRAREPACVRLCGAAGPARAIGRTGVFLDGREARERGA
jgi:hypothetical protein